MFEKKIIVLLFNVIVGIVVSIGYGIIINHIGFLISPEYYFKYKFLQMGYLESATQKVDDPNHLVTIVGIATSWWIGASLGILNVIIGYFQPTAKMMLIKSMYGVLLITVIIVTMSLVGYNYGKFQLAVKGVNWGLPAGLQDKTEYIAISSMINFTYLGAVIGITVVFINLFLKKYKSYLDA